MNDIKKIIECIESAEHYIREPHGDCNGKYELKQLKKATKLLKSFSMHFVSGSFSAEQLKEAYTDGFSDSTYDFDSENYR